MKLPSKILKKAVHSEHEESTGAASTPESHEEQPKRRLILDVESMEKEVKKLLGMTTFEPKHRYWLDTGSPQLNATLGSRDYGLAYGKMTEMRGKNHGGKTTLTTLLAGMAQRDNAAVGYLDAEDSRDEDWATTLGLVWPEVYKVYPKLVQDRKTEPPRLESAEELFGEAEAAMSKMRARGFKRQFWFVDSVANLRPAMVIEKGVTGQNARTKMELPAFLSLNLARWTGLAANYNAMIYLINQIRVNPMQLFGNPEYCLSGDVCVYLENGRAVPIRHIVKMKRQEKIRVLKADGSIGYSPILAWHNNGPAASKDNWIRVVTTGPGTACGYISLEATKNHHVFLASGEEVRADELRPGMAMSSWTERLFATPSVARDILVGSLLGDGSLATSSGGKHTAAFSLSNKIQPAYLKWKLSHFKFMEMKRYSSLGAVSHRSKYTVELKELRDNLYVGSVRKFGLEQWLSDRAMAVWYMDDGHLADRRSKRSTSPLWSPIISRKRGMRDPNERCRIASAIALWLGVSEKNIPTRYGIIGFTGEAKQKFFERIAPYVVSSMQYKLPIEYRTGKQKLESVTDPSPLLFPLPVTILSVTPGRGISKRFDLTVKEGCYFAGTKEAGVLVHNSPGGNAFQHTCQVRADVRRVKNGRIKNGDKVVGLVGLVTNFKNKAGRGSVQDESCAFAIRWNKSPARYEFMTKKEAEDMMA